jgi:RNA 3'-terminal phosphate cyclase-like protein
MRLQIVRRGAPPTGKGEVTLHIPTVRSLKTLYLTDPGRVKRVRGVAYGTKVREADVFHVVLVPLS